MWARVRGKTENALLRLPFASAYVFRPALIQPLHGIRSRTAVYRILYALATPLLPLLRRAFPAYVSTTEQIGRAMLIVARRGAPKRISRKPGHRRYRAEEIGYRVFYPHAFKGRMLTDGSASSTMQSS